MKRYNIKNLLDLGYHLEIRDGNSLVLVKDMDVLDLGIAPNVLVEPLIEFAEEQLKERT